ncbi:MAG: DUF1080 domain-containing protein [Phycisphaerales bacterium]|nr:DUF1080 domain-containing protein [Phycisphaerales bacterium]
MTRGMIGLSVAVIVGVCVPRVVASPGFAPLFDGRTLEGWRGAADATPDAVWRVERQALTADGGDAVLETTDAYGDVELILEWAIEPGSVGGVWLRGASRVGIGDPLDADNPAPAGSGALTENVRGLALPRALADLPPGQWNTFRIRMIGERVTVWLNHVLVTDDVVMEQKRDATRPVPARGPIALESQTGSIRFRRVAVRVIPPAEANAVLRTRPPGGFVPLFNGKNLDGWFGSVDGYLVDDGTLVCDPASGGLLFTDDTYGDFILRFEFRLPAGGNNGLAIRAPGTGDPAYTGMELQVLDNTADKFANLQPYQYHGSIYGLVPARRGYLRPVGEWNFQEVVCRGSRITVELNGTTIVDADIATIDTPMDGREHPGRHRARGHLGFMGHGDAVAFRGIRVLRLGP